MRADLEYVWRGENREQARRATEQHREQVQRDRPEDQLVSPQVLESSPGSCATRERVGTSDGLVSAWISTVSAIPAGVEHVCSPHSRGWRTRAEQSAQRRPRMRAEFALRENWWRPRGGSNQSGTSIGADGAAVGWKNARRSQRARQERRSATSRPQVADWNASPDDIKSWIRYNKT